MRPAPLPCVKTAALRRACTCILRICCPKLRLCQHAAGDRRFTSTNTPEKSSRSEEAFRTLPLYAVTVKVVENRGRDVAAFLCDLAPQIREYDYACFMHDKKAIQNAKPEG